MDNGRYKRMPYTKYYNGVDFGPNRGWASAGGRSRIGPRTTSDRQSPSHRQSRRDRWSLACRLGKVLDDPGTPNCAPDGRRLVLAKASEHYIRTSEMQRNAGGLKSRSVSAD